MEEKFYRDDFELSLRDQVDEFQMSPSKKVWQSIYNDLHPGRRWPSIMMSVVLLSTLLIIGIHHTDPRQSNALASSRALNEIPAKNLNSQTLNENTLMPAEKTSAQVASNIAAKKVREVDQNVSRVEKNASANPVVVSRQSIAIPEPANSILPGDQSISAPQDISLEERRSTPKTETEIVEMPNNTFIEDNFKPGSISVGESSVLAKVEPLASSGVEVLQTISAPIQNLATNGEAIFDIAGRVGKQDELAITDHAQLKAVRKRFSKISWSYYAAPLVSTAVFRGEHLRPAQASNQFTSLPQVIRKDLAVQKSAALGFEAGVQMRYALTNKVKITSGLHFTRSGYNITSNIVHPTLSNLALKNPETGKEYTRSFVTHYGDGTGSSTVLVNNYNYQASVPVGLQFTIFNNSNLQLNLAADLEPSYVVKGDAFVLSSDGRNYISVPDLLRKWNISSNFAPHISFKANKFNWNVGPNIRYQWLSTFQNSYTHKQHLINYGIRLGISK